MTSRLSRLERFEKAMSITQAAATTLAILIGGAWFLAQGEGDARANISHRVTQRALSSEWVWVNLAVEIKNEGNLELSLANSIVRAQQILPLDSQMKEKLARDRTLLESGQHRVEWPLLGRSYEQDAKAVLEPKETDILTYDFVLPATIETIRLYSFYEQQSDPPLGWSHASIHDLKANGR